MHLMTATEFPCTLQELWLTITTFAPESKTYIMYEYKNSWFWIISLRLTLHESKSIHLSRRDVEGVAKSYLLGLFGSLPDVTR